jgi:hypothetical protein
LQQLRLAAFGELVELHRQPSEILAKAVVQLARKTPSLFILRAYKAGRKLT